MPSEQTLNSLNEQDLDWGLTQSSVALTLQKHPVTQMKIAGPHKYTNHIHSLNLPKLITFAESWASHILSLFLIYTVQLLGELVLSISNV